MFDSLPVLTETPTSQPAILTRSARVWLPKRVLFTPDALEEKFGQQMYERISAAGLPIEILKSNRLTGLRGADERETYRNAKNTLAVVKAPRAPSVSSPFRLPPTGR
ncbi:spore photoproduct lyase family protein [Hymenobacter radiodurans]|uniref:spore photoproduct lyase family protein n=1 Tax=Hymenobacter radiodurans TaxID=2496028 RepID=UPI001F113E3D|nr:hypothetical protein [Hymenobacter radiodurans]